MPIHDVGYRRWKGEITATWSRWTSITAVGIRTALTSRWIRRILLAAWFPVIYFGIILFFIEGLMVTIPSGQISQSIGLPAEIPANQRTSNLEGDRLPQLAPNLTNQDEGNAVEELVRNAEEQGAFELRKRALAQNPLIGFLPNGEALSRALQTGGPSEFRHTVWCYLLSSFLQYSQGFMTLMIVGLIVPPLISRDVRSRALLLYYSRPITRVEYVLGKLAIPGFVLMMITLVPALVLYLVGVMLSPDLSVIRDTWDVPFRIILGTVVCVIPTCLIGLLLSSLTQESRFAGFAWFTVWGLGAVVWLGIYSSNSTPNGRPYESDWSLISIYSTIGRVQSWIFGLEMDIQRVLPSMVLLVVVSVVSAIWLYRRVSAPIRI